MNEKSLPSLKAIQKYWYTQERFDFVEAFDEKNKEFYCWACDSDVSQVQKCHIVARSLGGSNEPSNLFLMCKSCHLESPDTLYEEIFFDWLWEKRKHLIFGVNLNDIAEKGILLAQKFGAENVLNALEYVKSNSNEILAVHTGRLKQHRMNDFMKTVEIICEKRISNEQEQLTLKF
jgi:hypothetical protein